MVYSEVRSAVISSLISLISRQTHPCRLVIAGWPRHGMDARSVLGQRQTTDSVRVASIHDDWMDWLRWHWDNSVNAEQQNSQSTERCSIHTVCARCQCIVHWTTKSINNWQSVYFLCFQTPPRRRVVRRRNLARRRVTTMSRTSVGFYVYRP